MSSESQYRILFLSTGNTARSIFAEYFIRMVGKGSFEAYSAGTDPLRAQLKQLQDGFAVTEAIQEIRRREFTGKETKRKV